MPSGARDGASFRPSVLPASRHFFTLPLVQNGNFTTSACRRSPRHSTSNRVPGLATSAEAAALELEADQAASDTALLLHAQRLEAEERRALVELHDPAEVGLERGDGIVDLVAVEGVAHLEPERVAGAETDRLGAGGDDGVPQRHGVAVAAVQFEAVLAGVAGAGDEALRVGDAAD